VSMGFKLSLGFNLYTLGAWAFFRRGKFYSLYFSELGNDLNRIWDGYMGPVICAPSVHGFQISVLRRFETTVLLKPNLQFRSHFTLFDPSKNYGRGG